jgi:uracil-DNA glycosylase
VLERDRRMLFPMFHPSAGLRRPEVREQLFADARALRQAL